MNISNNIKACARKVGILGLLLAGIISPHAKAQLNPLAGIYFNNEYLGNPAMVGINEGLQLHMGYRQPWSAMPGAPKTQAITANYGSGKKVGLGLNVYSDEAGLIKSTRVMGSYAYHLPLNNESQKLHFGISLGFMDERVMNEDIHGDQNDISVGKFNQRETYIDGDFGLAFTTNRLTIQAAIPNMKDFLKIEDVNAVADRSTFYTAASYKFYFPNALDGFGIEPKMAMRGVHGFHNIVDAGANFTVANGAAHMMAMYHSSESLTIGIGVLIKNFGAVSGNYTTATAALSEYTSGNFQIGLRVDVFRKKSGLD